MDTLQAEVVAKPYLWWLLPGLPPTLVDLMVRAAINDFVVKQAVEMLYEAGEARADL
jgi:hypothetical protein